DSLQSALPPAILIADHLSAEKPRHSPACHVSLPKAERLDQEPGFMEGTQRFALLGRLFEALRRYSGKPAFLRRAFSRGSPRTKSNSGYVRSSPNRTGPIVARRSSACKVRSLSPKPAKISACRSRPFGAA